MYSEEQINPWINFQPLGWISFAPLVTWPIITANKISIYAMSEADKRGGWGAEAFHPNDAYSFNDNPLRAAMIVFLMMQEPANVQDNTA
ncbi:phage protein NinX family protein [Enterobacter hormaechei]|uniref:phage protein NinX family protein n=1 Tax=Enterobacter hormaechei TaxID=158836 RepID=UPI0037517ED7